MRIEGHLARLPGPPVGFVRPCEPTLVDRPPAGVGWLHEVKHDGFRLLVRKLGERSKVWSRRGADFTDRFSGIAEAVRGLKVDRALIDGEAVVLRHDEGSDFGALMTKRRGAQAVLVAFDLLRLVGGRSAPASDRVAASGNMTDEVWKRNISRIKSLRSRRRGAGGFWSTRASLFAIAPVVLPPTVRTFFLRINAPSVCLGPRAIKVRFYSV